MKNIARISFIFALTALCAAGCSAPRLAVHQGGDPVDMERAGEMLSRYNAALPKVRAMGKARLEGEGEADYALRVERGLGARFDCFAGPAMKQLLAAACSSQGKCEIYLPEDNTIYSDGTKEFAQWFESLLGGRVPVIGAVRSANFAHGGTVIRLEDEKGWESVLVAQNGLPTEALFGEKDEGPSLKISWDEFVERGDGKYPSKISITGEKGEEKLLLTAKRVEAGEGKNPLAVTIEVPEGVRRKGEGVEIMEKLGIFR